MGSFCEEIEQAVGCWRLIWVTHRRGWYVIAFHHQLLQSGGSVLARQSHTNPLSTNDDGVDRAAVTSVFQANRELMPGTLDPLSDRACRMIDAYSTGIELTEPLKQATRCRRASLRVRFEPTISMMAIQCGTLPRIPSLGQCDSSSTQRPRARAIERYFARLDHIEFRPNRSP